jgi:hypothetical protein
MRGANKDAGQNLNRRGRAAENAEDYDTALDCPKNIVAVWWNAGTAMMRPILFVQIPSPFECRWASPISS